MISNKGQFKKGNIPWHTGTKGIMRAWNKGIKTPSNGVLEQYCKTHKPWNKGKKMPQISGKNSHSYTHGMAHTRFNTTWKHIKNKCYKVKSPDFKNYGGRGIKCLWKSFEEFKNNMYESYKVHVKEFGEKNTTIERRDNDGNYEPRNCRWATRQEQGRNKRNLVWHSFKGKRFLLIDLAKISGLKELTIRRRIKSGWSIEKALTKPLMKNQFV